MTTSPDILAKQAEYAARPFAARWADSHFKGTFRFHTEAEAIDYLLAQYQVAKAQARRPRHVAGWRGVYLSQCHLERRGEIIPGHLVLMAPDLTN